MARLAAISALLLLALSCASAFKEHDFKKCADASFCNRNRGQTGPGFHIVPGSISTRGAKLSATVGRPDAPNQFSLSLVAYHGFVRLAIDESPSQGRYQVSDVLLPGLEAMEQPWQAEEGKDVTTLKNGVVTVKLGHKPLRVDVSVNGVPALQFNSRDMFNFEHRRQKQDGDPVGWWEETFNGHRDSKPKGPEAMSLDLVLPGFQHLYGIPEHATSMALKPTVGVSEPYRMYNLDVFEYLHESPFGLYGSIPLMLAHKAGLSIGAFWLNAAEMFIDVSPPSSAGSATQWIAESGIVDLFLFVGPTPAAVSEQYAAATGTTAMPQLFALGYHQCRWNYKDQPDVRQVDGGFDEHAIPYDVLWLDIEHTNGKRYMTWDSNLFPEPVAMQNDVASRTRRMVTIIDPHVKRDGGYYMHSEAQSLGYYVKNRDSADFDGWCWPGSSSYLDVTSPAVRSWWADQFDLSRYQGSTPHLYTWNDMNEPSVFNGPEITMHKDNLHAGGVEHRDVHNLYGYYYHMASAEGLKRRGFKVHGQDGDRPFVLSRAFFAGTQRVGPIWTGDNAADWDHLRVSVPMLLTLGVSGLPFSGADVGGFFGNPDTELLTRWYQVGAYYPFFRGHAHLETQRREPWLFGEPHTSRIRTAIRSRYALMPYLYTLFRFANTSGAPVMRPLWYEFPDNAATFGTQEEFMLGGAILVRPVLTAGASSVAALLPRGQRWYDVASGAEVKPGSGKSSWLGGAGDQQVNVPVTMDAIPAFYRGGSVVPRKERPRRSTTTMERDPYTLIVALDANGAASGSLYLDDGCSFAFARGEYMHRAFTFRDMTLTARRLTELRVPTGEVRAVPKFSTPNKVERIVLLGLPSASGYTATIRVDGGGETVALTQGAALPSAPAATHAWVLRKPDLPIGGDWTVEIKRV